MAFQRGALLLLLPLAWAARLQHVQQHVQQEQKETAETEVTAPPLCAPEIVRDTCRLFGGETDVTLKDVQQMLAADAAVMASVWESMGLPSDTRVSCMELCAAVVNTLGEGFQLPPSSDVACYQDKGVTKCDLDLSPVALGNLVPAGLELPNLHDKVPPPEGETAFKDMEAQGPRVLARAKTVDYATHDLLVRQANLFRIYPTPATKITQEVPAPRVEALLQEYESALQNSSGVCEFWCSDFPKHCQYRMSCGPCPQCGRTPTRAPGLQCNPSCLEVRDPCSFTLLCSGCPQCGGNAPVPKTTTTTKYQIPDYYNYYRPPVPTTTATTTKYQIPDYYNYYRPPSTTAWWSPGVGAGSWKTEVQKRNVQAQAYVNKAIMKLKSRQADKANLKWFGATANTDQHVQEEMIRVLNAVANMMGNVEYVFPGPQCSPNTYAYVYPRGFYAKDASGKFVFYLCQLYMDSEVSVQIETLTHEGSHHATSYTDDVCMDEFYGGKKPTYVEVPKASLAGTVNMDDTFDYKVSSYRTVPAVVRMIKGSVVVLQLEPETNCQSKAYGRQPCADLAKKDAVKALRNADNVCYWIQDLTDAS